MSHHPSSARLALAPALAAVVVLLAVLAGQVGWAQAAEAPVEPYAAYQPQTTCSSWDKPGTKALATWMVKTYGGAFGGISRSCAGKSVSEHKEGRAFDWTLDARKASDRARAVKFLTAIRAVGPSGQPAELGRRMGIMYVIWNDRMYASYRQFRSTPYLAAGCTSAATCSPTLQHRDHLHVSLTRAAGMGRTSWYAGRVPAPAPTPTPTPTPSATPTP